jgi:hypothetical protein
MYLPFELIQNIYDFSDIDSKLLLNKIYNHSSFIHPKLIISNDHFFILNNFLSLKYTHYICMESLKNKFSSFSFIL